MVDEGVDALARGEVPQLDGAVVGARCNESLVGGKGARSNPVVVGGNSEEGLSVCDVVDLEGLVVGAGENELAVGRNGDGADRFGVLFDHLRVPFHRVVPQTNCAIM